MKTTNHFLLLLSVLILSSCNYQLYQVYETTSQDVKQKNGSLVYEGENINVGYDFWNDHGQFLFAIKNKTDKPIYIDLKRSHLIYNGYSRNYKFGGSEEEVYTKIDFDDNPFTSDQVQVNRKVETQKKRIHEIPPKSYKILHDFNLKNSLYSSCDLRKNEMGEKEFSKETTPLHFRNYVTYSFSPEIESPRTIDHSFWVEKITNMKERKFEVTVTKKVCPDDRFGTRMDSLVYKDNSNFYIKYGVEE